MAAPIFEVDRKGLAKLLRTQGLHRMLEELISNAFDEEITTVNVSLQPTESQREYRITVEDDSPEGFKNLEHAYTLFAESYKKTDSSKRGRFNFGEKWVVAACKWAKISTTKGTVVFEEDGRHHPREKRAAGTLFEGLITATKEEVEKCHQRIGRIIVPEGVTMSYNGTNLPTRKPVVTFKCKLPTVATNEQGETIRTERDTQVLLYEVMEGERATVYELGIPVLRLDEKSGDVYHMNVMQKVPLPLNRDNVPPRFLKQLRTEVVNHTFQLLTKEQVGGRAITEGLADAEPEAVTSVIEKRFGAKRAISDPSDLEANARLASEGYTIIPARSFSKDVWANVKASGAAIASGTLRPTPKPYSNDPDAPARKLLDSKDKTPGMERMEKYIKLLANEACGVSHLEITWVDDSDCAWNMCCGPANHGHSKLDINVAALGKKWFDDPPAIRWEVDDILLDEFGHFRESNHLSENYYRTLREFGSKIGVLKLTRPDLFKDFR